jgi:hypothetical protein
LTAAAGSEPRYVARLSVVNEQERMGCQAGRQHFLHHKADASAKLARNQLDAAFAAVGNTRALVLDLLGNSGG